MELAAESIGPGALERERCAVARCSSVTFFDQFLLMAVTVCVPVIAFHDTFVPCTTDVDVGLHL